MRFPHTWNLVYAIIHLNVKTHQNLQKTVLGTMCFHKLFTSHFNFSSKLKVGGITRLVWQVYEYLTGR